MPFGNSGVDFEMDGALPRLVFAKPRPLGNGTADSSGATAWSFARREVSAGPLQKAFSQLLLLAWGEQITAQCQGQPQRSHQFERFNKAHAQHWCLPLGRVGSLSGQQGRWPGMMAAISWAPVSGVWLCRTSVLRNWRLSSR